MKQRPEKPVIGVILSDPGPPAERVDDDFVNRLAPLTHLNKLHLANPAISDEGVKRLAQFKGLEHLDLAFTDVSDAGLKHLANIKTLRAMFGYPYHPFVTILCESLATSERYTIKSKYFFEPYNYFNWVGYDLELLRKYLTGRCREWLDP